MQYCGHYNKIMRLSPLINVSLIAFNLKLQMRLTLLSDLSWNFVIHVPLVLKVLSEDNQIVLESFSIGLEELFKI